MVEKKEQTETTKEKSEIIIKKTENTSLKKIQMLSNLASACENPKLIEAFESLKNGDELYTIFVEAVNSKIELLMNNEMQKATKSMADVQAAASVILNQIGHMHQIMTALHNATLIKALGLLNKNLGGVDMPAEQEFILPNPTSNSQPADRASSTPAQPQQLSTPAPKYSNNAPTVSANERKRGGTTPGFF